MAMIEAAEAEGRIEPGRTTIVEATSGNTGIALAFVCAARGYELVLTMPQGMSREREGLLRLYGARVEITESMGGMNEAVEAAQRIAGSAATPSSPTSSRTPRTPRSTAARRPRRSGATRAARSTCSWRASAPAGRSPAPASCSRSATPTCTSSRSSRPARRPLRRHARAAQDPGHRRRLRPRGPQPRRDRRDHPGHRRGRDRDGARLRAHRGRPRRASPAARRCGPRSRSGSRPEIAGKRIVVDHAGLRRALRDHAVLRPVSLTRASSSATRASSCCPSGAARRRSGSRPR